MFLLLGGSSFAQTPEEKKETPKQEESQLPSIEEVSKAVGVIYTNMLRDMQKKVPGADSLDPKIILQVMQDILVDRKDAKYDDSRGASITLERFVKGMYDKRNRENQEKEAKFLAENGKKEGVVTTKSGLQYLMIKEGQGAFPTVEDTVQVHYRGMLIDGTEFDSSIKRGEPIKFNPLQVIPGWTEGLCLLRKGGKIRLFIPSKLAYGERGAGDKIPPYSTLIFDVELLDLIKGEPIPLAEVSKDDPNKLVVDTKDKK